MKDFDIFEAMKAVGIDVVYVDEKGMRMVRNSLPEYEPVRRVQQTEHGYVVYVKPPPAIGEYPETSVFLTPDQFERYKNYLDNYNQMMIQEALPDLSTSEREILMSGLGDEDFHKIAASGEDNNGR